MNNRSTSIQLLDPDVRHFITSGFDSTVAPIWNKYVNVKTSQQRSERSSVLIGPGGVARKPEGAAIVYDSMIPGTTKNFIHDTFALGLRASMELLADNLHQELFNAAKMLGASARKSIEYQVADLLNSGFSTSVRSSGDGVAFFSASHTFGKDTVVTLTGPSALNISTFYEALYVLRGQKDGRGYNANIGNGKLQLIVPIALTDVAYAIKNSMQTPGSADNDASYAASLNLEIIVNPYLTSTTAWFLLSPGEHDLTYFQRMKVQTYNDGDFNTLDKKWALVYRHSLGQNDPRGIVANQGV